MSDVKEYIEKNIDIAVCSCLYDTEECFGLPYPYSVPTVGERFHAMFYWDTYFTHLALIRLGRLEQIKNDLDNFASLVKRFGYVPNSNKRVLANRSQPPFFALMIKESMPYFENKEWLEKMYGVLVTENEFWSRERNTAQGLAHYGGGFEAVLKGKYARSFCKRVGYEYSEQMQDIFASNYFAQAESGWDFNPRFGLCSADYCAVDLNSLLWSQESILSEIAEKLGKNGEAIAWKQKARMRAERMREYLWKDEVGAFLDRNSATDEFGRIFSVASFYPLFVGLATESEAKSTVEKLSLLMHGFGVAPCQETASEQRYQWASPNGWPCLQVVIAKALSNYGYTKEAEEIGQKYISTVEENFKRSGKLWEKYNVDTGNSDAVAEYETPEMLGWTAGAYLYFKCIA